ncbi:hypothetical protein ES705_22510 [subsurface metagenome]
MTSPDTIKWMGGSNCNKTVNDNIWSISWWNSWDLNGIKEYELIVSKTDEFSEYDTYWISESEEYGMSLDFSDMEHGNYYYKIRAIDNTSFNYFDDPNIGEWSAILKVSYPDSESEQEIIPGYSILLISLTIGITIISLIIKLRRRKSKI